MGKACPRVPCHPQGAGIAELRRFPSPLKGEQLCSSVSTVESMTCKLCKALRRKVAVQFEIGLQPAPLLDFP